MFRLNDMIDLNRVHTANGDKDYMFDSHFMSWWVEDEMIPLQSPNVTSFGQINQTSRSRVYLHKSIELFILA